MNSFESYVATVDKRAIMANVNRWRIAHGKPIDPGFKNAPTIMPKRKVVVAAVDSVMGKEGK